MEASLISTRSSFFRTIISSPLSSESSSARDFLGDFIVFFFLDSFQQVHDAHKNGDGASSTPVETNGATKG
jgi:hypothetical protein